MNNKLVIFDLDGTLLNTIADLGNAVNHTLAEKGLPQHTLTDYKMMVGHGMRNLVKSALPEQYRQDVFVLNILNEFLDFYMDNIDKETVPYPGVPELLSSIDSLGIKMAVASNKLQAGTDKLIRAFFPSIQFTDICGNGKRFSLKPDPALVKYLMSNAGTDKETTIMVGDSETDIQTAHNAGIKVIAVTWGFRPEEYLREADYTVDDTRKLLDVISNIWL